MSEKFEEFFGIHEALLFEFENIVHVALMASFQLGEDLAVKIEMPEIQLSRALDEWTAFAPTGELGNEKIWTGQFDIRVERVLNSAIASKNPSGSGSALISISIVFSRQPKRSAVAPPVR